MQNTDTGRIRGFTLVEVLVVMAIIAIIIAWLTPALQQAKAQARLHACISNVRQIQIAIDLYTNEHDGYYPVPPLETYFSYRGLDMGWIYMGQLYGGDDIGEWPVTPMLPAEVRPLARYLNPYSHVYRCPADDQATPWTYGQKYWEYLTSSYRYNATPSVGYPGLYALRPDEVTWPSLTIGVGDKEWGCTRPNLPANDLWFFKNDPRAWWHPEAFRTRKADIAFLDGHAEYTAVQILVANTDTYRRDAFPGQGIPTGTGDF